MKAVCVSCFNYYDNRMRGIIDYLESEGFQVKYFITDFDHYNKKKYEFKCKNVIQLHVPAYKKNISLQRLLSHAVFAQKLISRIKKYEPDVIYCMVPPNILVRNISKYKKQHPKCKVIFDIFDMWPESFPYKSNNILVKKFFKSWALLRDKYLDRADTLICVSQKAKDVIDRRYNVNSKVLKPNLKAEYLPHYISKIDDVLSFCYIGNVNHITDIELGTNLLSKFSEKRKVILHIIGEGENGEKWFRLLKKANIEVVLHGVIFDEDKKKEIFQQCTFGLNIPRQEINASMALKAIEYMRHGIPFLNSGIGDNEVMVRENGIGVNINRDDLQETVDIILSMTNDDVYQMHLRCLNYYESAFTNPDYKELFGF